jgi:tRNA-2-methylthio-N6-dimethylallyladenosine synthase
LADVVVLTTCSVREKAHQKVRSAIGRFRHHKEHRPEQVVVVAGCVAQQEGQQLLDDAPHVDVVVGPDYLLHLPALIEQVQAAGERQCAVGFEDQQGRAFLPLGVLGERAVSAYVTVQKGCDQGCAYCIVPLVRGPGRCRQADEVVAEVEALAQRGTKEVVLLGQTVNSYQQGGGDFPHLLNLVDQVEGIERIRYESAHPRFLSQALIEAHVNLPALCEHLHLPVQSGSNDVLARMGRGHSREDFLRWVSSLRDQCPGVGLSTDLFVGFPGESDEDFEGTLALMEEVAFDGAFSFKYSPRPGTPAAAWDDDIPLAVKVERLRRLQDRQEAITSAYLARFVGSVVEVLVEGESRQPGQVRGRTRRNTIVNIDLSRRPEAGEAEQVRQAPRAGDLLSVRITQAGGHSLRGELLLEPAASYEVSATP